MNESIDGASASTLLFDELRKAGIVPSSIDVRPYPEETILVAYVDEGDFSRAIKVAAAVDVKFSKRDFSGFVTIRKNEAFEGKSSSQKAVRGVLHAKAEDLANLLTARSRTSEIQPSLEYVREASDRLEIILTARNHLVFGRRGAGKTTLMVEAKRRLEGAGHLTVWVNMQTHRHSSPEVVFLWVMQNIIERFQAHYGNTLPRVLAELSELESRVRSLLGQNEVTRAEARRVIPHAQRMVKRFTSASACRVYVFLDDLHYLRRNDQPLALDMVHGALRDSDAWMKVACIKHLSRWFEHVPPTGLQTGHDADHVDLDLTLESPTEAKRFLDQVLNVYAKHVGLTSARSVFSEEALNRLVLASGAVPRDYLVLAAGAIRIARGRQSARLAGVQDVNRAAGEQSKVKIAELEDDAASSDKDGTQALLRTLTRVREFCLDVKRFTFFRIDFRDKEGRQKEYSLMQGLLDVRILHLISSSLSDKREAGRRSEVYMLDLSQFSGERLKKRLHVLDFVDSHLVLKETSSSVQDKKGDTSARLLDLLRKGPMLELSELNKGDAAN